jgi:mannonate dehydratase
VHERIAPSDAVRFAKEMEQFRLFFLEDLLAPEDSDWFARVRQVCTTPLAMGELFNNPREWQPLIANRHIDYIRMHISQMGGLTPARKVALMAEQFGVRTAWHAPGDCSPIGHACNLHLDLVSANFGIQEWCGFPEAVYEVFPGCPVQKNGMLMQPEGGHGWGVDIDEKAAARFPIDTSTVDMWTQLRRPDGSPARP